MSHFALMHFIAYILVISINNLEVYNRGIKNLSFTGTLDTHTDEV